MNKIIIGLGNTGSVIVRDIAKKNLNNVRLFAIDSQAKHIAIDHVSNVEYIPIVADDNAGSGRDRERGREMFRFNLEQGKLDKMLEECKNTDTIFVVSSAAGGTGSGSCPELCRELIDDTSDRKVIPIIICPNMEDPDAYHYNTTDLMVELKDAKVGPYVIFRNPSSSDYEKINAEIVEAITVMLGNHYETTDNDSIDASDLNNILSTVGRMMVLSVTGETVDEVRKKLLKQLVSSYQPNWDSAKVGYGVAAFSMKSINAGEDSKLIENDILPKLEHCSDRYKNIVIDDNNGMVEVTLIIAGLPPVELKDVTTEYNETASIGDSLKKAERPRFMKRRHVSFNAFKADATLDVSEDKNVTITETDSSK